MSPSRKLCLVAAVSLFLATASVLTVGAAPAKAPAGKSGGHDARMEAAFNAYLNKVRSKVVNAWLMPDGKNHVVLTATIGSDGAVTEIAVSSTPSNPQAEQSSSDAFNQTQPLDPLPAGAESAKLSLTFDSTVDPHGDSNSNVSAKIDPVVKKTDSPPADAPKQ